MTSVVLIGATGLIGSHLSDRLLNREGASVHAVLRQASGRVHPGWRETVAPPAEWPEIVHAAGAEVAVSAIGTTMRAAGSEAAFRAVDFDIAVAFAKAAKAAGARHMITVSSVGASSGPSNFYLNLKAEMERELETLSFHRLDIFRPGLLRGKRGGDRRLGERVGIVVSPLVNLFLRGRLDRFAAIDAAVVAAAMEAALDETEAGVHVHHNGEIRALARRARSSGR